MLKIYTRKILLNHIIPDHNADVFNPPLDTTDGSGGLLNKIVEFCCGGLIRWDAVYFMHIAQNGYIFLNSLAFFPLFPLTVYLIANSIFYPLQLFLNYRSVLILSAVFCNGYLFVQAAKLLFWLGKDVLRDEDLAYLGSLLFCISPASIFMTAPYSETLYFFLIILGLYYFEKGMKMSCGFMFALGVLARSNGLVNIGFQLHHFLKTIFAVILRTVNFNSKSSISSSDVFSLCRSIIIQLSYSIIFVAVILIPFLLYQIQYVAKLFCTRELHNQTTILSVMINYGRSRGYHILGDRPPVWCNNVIPFSYSYIQNSHWGVGFLEYYEFKQIPNFLLALPVTILSLSGVWCYYKLNKSVCWTLGVKTELDKIKKDYTTVKLHSDCSDTKKGGDSFVNERLLPYMAHILFLTITGWMFIHIQVLTRLLFSSSPILYWFAAYCMIKTKHCDTSASRQENRTEEVGLPWKNILTSQILNFQNQTIATKCILIYFIGYFFIGTFMFSNFLPWT